MVHASLSSLGFVPGGAQTVIEPLYVDGEDFQDIGDAFESRKTVIKTILGNATLRYMRQRELVDFTVDWIEKYRR